MPILATYNLQFWNNFVKFPKQLTIIRSSKLAKLELTDVCQIWLKQCLIIAKFGSTMLQLLK